jgi:hypothetical protein
VPLTFPGGKPVTEVPGLSPRFPVITVEPVLVMVDPASSAKPSAAPRFIADVIVVAPTAPANANENAIANAAAGTLLSNFIMSLSLIQS